MATCVEADIDPLIAAGRESHHLPWQERFSEPPPTDQSHDLFGEASLRRAIREYMARHHTERNHQGHYNRFIKPSNVVTLSSGVIQRRGRSRSTIGKRS